ncbi:MAG: methyltransferase domain-containing protein [Pseudomonadota bacterium]
MMPQDPAKILRAVFWGWLAPKRYDCCVCGRRVGRFLPYRDGSRGAPPAMRALRCIGSDRDHFECPRCGAHDRERHLLLYLKASGLWDGLPRSSVLHFAPERRLGQLLEAQGPSRYIKADLYPARSDIERIDILDIPYPDNSFDLVIANHVLEHVSDDRRAVAELARVLKPGGHAVLQTPFSELLLATFADAGIDSDEARLHAYGQEDHVRLFGSDIFARFADAGPLVDKSSPHNVLLAGTDAGRQGVNPCEPFFLFAKPAVVAAS